MQLKRILATVMMAAVLVTSATACGNGAASSNSSINSNVSTAEVSLSSTAGAGYSSDNDTKVKQMLEKVTLNGKPLPIPYTLDDLPEGFSFDDDVTVYGDDVKYQFCDLLYYGEDLDSVALCGYEEGQSVNDFKACSIGFFTLTDEKFSDTVQIDGLDITNTMDDVLEKFGEPTTIESGSSSSSAYIYYYEIDDNQYVSFWGNEKKEIIDIMAYNKIV